MPPEDASTPVMVFSHPNHELAVFGLVQRLRPRLIYLTDGGGPARVAQTERGLASIALLDRATFLNYSESSLYEALLRRDGEFFQEMARRVFDSCAGLLPSRVLCDAVEFYNPLHDISLPVVHAACRRLPGVPIFEVPLVYQKPGESEAYDCQRLPPSLRSRQIELQLTESELDAKLRARDQIYGVLMQSMGVVISALPLEHLRVEVVAPAASTSCTPGPQRVLRYEWRGQLLRQRGEIQTSITYADHYQPVSSSLMAI